MNLHTHPAADLGPATVLAVDDSKSNRLLLKMTLNKFGHRVLEAENGLKAFEVLAEQRGVDLIILDLLMPQMNGFEFLKARQDKPEVKAIPVIINSSWMISNPSPRPSPWGPMTISPSRCLRTT